MADLRFEPKPNAVLIRPLTELGQQWAGKHIDRAADPDGTVSVNFAEAPEIERAAREDGLAIGELAI